MNSLMRYLTWAIKKISPEPIRFMANTHIHGDHTAGNPLFGKMGVVIFAREELREQMIHPPRIRRRQATVGEHAKADRDSPEFFVLRRVNESRRGSACDLGPEFFVLRRVNESRRGSACDLVGSAGIPAHPRPTRVSSILPMCNFAQNGGFWRSAAGVG